MTVCIAQIYDNQSIIALADKKLTIDLGVTAVYEINENKKIVPLTNTCAALFAGNVASANEVLKKAKATIAETDSVEQIAKKIIAVSQEVYRFAIESQILNKHGLDMDSFNQQHKVLDPTFVSSTLQLIGQSNLGFEVLVLGKQNDQPQILKIGVNSALSDETPIGYACIGSGGSHANLSLIESHCHPAIAQEQALHAIAKAKRKAESDPNVGEKSDILVLEDAVKLVDESVVKSIFVAYDSSQHEVAKITKATSKTIGGILNGAAAKPAK